MMPVGVVLWAQASNFLVGLLQALLFRGVLLQLLRQTVSMWAIGADVVPHSRRPLERTPKLY
jgi:hypothetical protein